MQDDGLEDFHLVDASKVRLQRGKKRVELVLGSITAKARTQCRMTVWRKSPVKSLSKGQLEDVLVRQSLVWALLLLKRCLCR